MTEAEPEVRVGLHVRVRPSTLTRIDAEAELDHRNRSDMVRVLLVEALDAREARRKAGTLALWP